MTFDSLEDRELARMLGVPAVHLHEGVPSTLDLAHELGAQGAPHGTLVLAERQTAGRGRQGRAWWSPPGGIWLAMLARPGEPPRGGALAVRFGLAARAAVAEAAPATSVHLKWPNDVMVADRKAGGILCEARWSAGVLGWIAVGVGINVRGPLPADLGDRAIALQDVAPDVTRLGVLLALVPRLMRAARAPALLDDAEIAEFLRIRWPRADTGAATGLARDGALLVRRADGSLDRRVAPSQV